MPHSDHTDDPIIKDLLPGYLQRRQAEIEVLAAALENEDFDALYTIGHNLLGSGAAYGLPRISEHGKTLEKLARARDVAGIDATIGEIRDYLAEICG